MEDLLTTRPEYDRVMSKPPSLLLLRIGLARMPMRRVKLPEFPGPGFEVELAARPQKIRTS